MDSTNTIAEKSFHFAVRIVKLTEVLQANHCPRELISQILRSGTSIGANIRESKNAQSEQDFVHKLSIALKEADETLYWTNLLYQTKYISQSAHESITSDNRELIAMLTSIIKTMKLKIARK